MRAESRPAFRTSREAVSGTGGAGERGGRLEASGDWDPGFDVSKYSYILIYVLLRARFVCLGQCW